MDLLWYLVIGGLAGFLVGKLMSGHGYGVIGDVLLGVVGSLVGGLLFDRVLKIQLAGTMGHFVVAFVGALIIVGIVHIVRRERV